MIKAQSIPARRVELLLAAAQKTRVLVVGDVMLDQFLWGKVARISPEAPVPIVEIQRENFMPGGAANVARNLAALNIQTSIFGLVGKDSEATKLKRLLTEQMVDTEGLISEKARMTSVKTRIVAHQQQVVRVDRETKVEALESSTRKLLAAIEKKLEGTAAIIVGDYGKGCVTQELLEGLKTLCRPRGVWISMDPKPVHQLDLNGLSLVTPNRKEAFELAGEKDADKGSEPLEDGGLLKVAEHLLNELAPALLLITLGEQGMLLCQRRKEPVHIPTRAQEVFDVSGAGDTVIASFTLAIAGGASPLEAAIISNHAAGIVVGKVGTAVVHAGELVGSFAR